MVKNETLEQIIDNGVISVIRIKEGSSIFKIVEALITGGIRCIEITMTVPKAEEIIYELDKKFSSTIVLGAGTVTDAAKAIDIIESGAKFVVSPILNYEIINVCKDKNVLCIPGCFTPTEIFNALSAGAEMVKLFPASVLGPRYIKDLHGPFPEIKLIPTGGVTVENVGEWIKAGAVAVGIGSQLFDIKAIEEGNFFYITERSTQLIENLNIARKIKP